MKIIIAVTNISDELVGKTICGYTLRKVYRGSLESDEKIKEGLMSWHVLDRMCLRDNYSFVTYDTMGNELHYDSFFQSDKDGVYYLYFIKEFTTNDETGYAAYVDGTTFVKAMTLIKKSGVSFSFVYSFETDKGTGISNSEIHNFYSVRDYPILTLESGDFEKIQKIQADLMNVPLNSEIARMIELWMESRRVFSFEAKFILRISMLEMVYTSAHGLKNGLSRLIALLFSSNSQEYSEISQEIKKIYTIRSEFLHAGKETKTSEINYHLLLEDYCRRVILKLLAMNNKGITIKQINKAAEISGYGDLESNLTHKE